MAGPSFRAAPVHVRVPATSANLGPGFDALGLALGLYDDVVARIGEQGVVIDVAGEGEHLPRDESHLVIRAMRATFAELGGQPRGIELSAANRIPHSRGLGSSAAAITAGVLLARALVLGGEQALPDARVLDLASQIEGHPDNVAAALLGGLSIAWAEGERFAALRRDVDPQVRPVAFIPPFTASTEQARGLLPEQIAHRDGAFAAGRAALLVAALTGGAGGGQSNDDGSGAGGREGGLASAVFAGTEDCLHQQYRAVAMPESAQLVALLRQAGHAAVISGAGPTVLALATSEQQVAQLQASVPGGWQVLAPGVDIAGARIVQ